MKPWRCLTTQKEGDEVSRRIDKTIEEHRRQLQKEHRICVFGLTKSGASTLLLQLKTIFEEGYSVQLRKSFTKMIIQRIFADFKCLTNGMSSWNEPYSNPENQLYAQWIQDVDTTHVTTLEARYAHALQSLWDDQGIQNQYISNLHSIEYYMNNLDRIAAAGYIPNDLDILWLKKSYGAFLECSFNIGDRIIRMWEFRRCLSRIERSYLDADVLLFVASLSAYDESWCSSRHPDPDPETNCMRESVLLFYTILHNRHFCCMDVILFLNKMDVLAEKIQTSDLQTYFPEYTGKKGDAEAAVDFIRGLYLTVAVGAQRPVYVRITCAIDAEDVRQAFIDVKDNVLAKRIIK